MGEGNQTPIGPVTEGQVVLDGRVVTREELERARQNPPPGRKLIEVSPGHYRFLTRLQG